MNTAKYLWLLLGIICVLNASAQNYVLSNDIPVSVSGNLLKAAWAGGLTAPQMSAIDLDNDAVLDLVVYDRDGDHLLTFQNGGTVGQVDYTFAPAYIAQFPTALSDWVLLRDFDADGFIDIFTAVPRVSNVRVFRNTSALSGGSLSFSLHQDTVQTNYPPALPLYASKSDFPAIEDIDGDGDLDFLTFQLGGTKVEWHKNLSVENTGGLSGMEFQRNSRCFGHFEEDIFGCSALIGRVPCGIGERGEEAEAMLAKTALHAGSTILALDLDNNGLKDLVIGDVGCATLYGLHNGGTSAIADFVTYEPDFPASDTAARVLLFPAAYYLDIDNDGLKDMLVAPNNIGNVEDQKSIQYFKNVGANSLPDLKFQQYGILQDEMIDIGSAAMPVFLDYNGDGRTDILIGAAGRYDSLVDFHPLLALYENTGTAQQPAFTQVSADYMQLRNHPAFVNASHLRPAAGDLDGDGDVDLLLGNVDGAIFYFNNTAGAGNPANFVLQTANFSNIDVGFNSAPQLIDLDADNDLDLLVGNHQGYLHYFNNAGTVANPNFVLVSDTFGHVKIDNFSGQSTSNGYAQPWVVDYDNDNDLDLLVGAIDGQVYVYENISLAPGAVFAQVGDLFGRDFGTRASPAAAVLDSARLSFVVGDNRGGLVLLRAGGPVAVAPATVADAPHIQLSPNPANDHFRFTIAGTNARSIERYVVYDALGHLQATAAIQSLAGEIDVHEWTAGLYFVVFLGKNKPITQRLMITH
jgi:hypothetical protein